MEAGDKMNYEEQRRRYHNDAVFHTLVNTIYEHLFLPGQFSVGEIRDAVTFAAIKFEHERVRPAYTCQNDLCQRECHQSPQATEAELEAWREHLRRYHGER